VIDPIVRELLGGSSGLYHQMLDRPDAGRICLDKRTPPRLRRRSLAICLLAALSLSTFPAHAGARSRVVWVTLEGSGRTVKVDIASGRTIASFATPGRPHNVAVSAGVVAVAMWNSTKIAIIRSGHVRTVTLGGAPHDMKIWRDRIVAANQGGSRVQVVRTDGAVLRSVALPYRPHDLAVNPRTGKVWITLEGTGKLATFRLGSDAPVRYVPTGRRPHDILFAPDGRLWITGWDGTALVYDMPGLHLVRAVRLGSEAHHLAFTPDGRFVWITDHGASAVFVLRTSPVHRVDRIPFPGEPHHVAITLDGARAVVADHANGRLVIYDTATHRRVKFVPVGPAPHGVATG
jgi:DNA-binding beta-propeller fold protein YncE